MQGTVSKAYKQENPAPPHFLKLSTCIRLA